MKHWDTKRESRGKETRHQDKYQAASILFPASSSTPMVSSSSFIECERVTVSNVASTMAALMVSNPMLPLMDLASLRLLSCGGSPQPPDIVRACIAQFGCEFFVSFGMTGEGCVTGGKQREFKHSVAQDLPKANGSCDVLNVIKS